MYFVSASYSKIFLDSPPLPPPFSRDRFINDPEYSRNSILWRKATMRQTWREKWQKNTVTVDMSLIWWAFFINDFARNFHVCQKPMACEAKLTHYNKRNQTKYRTQQTWSIEVPTWYTVCVSNLHMISARNEKRLQELNTAHMARIARLTFVEACISCDVLRSAVPCNSCTLFYGTELPCLEIIEGCCRVSSTGSRASCFSRHRGPRTGAVGCRAAEWCHQWNLKIYRKRKIKQTLLNSTADECRSMWCWEEKLHRVSFSCAAHFLNSGFRKFKQLRRLKVGLGKAMLIQYLGFVLNQKSVKRIDNDTRKKGNCGKLHTLRIPQSTR